MATLIKTNGENLEISPLNGTDFQLEELQDYVGGYIEIVNFRNGQIMVVNEDGKGSEDPNDQATELALEHQAILGWDFIAGSVVLCNEEEVK